MERIKLIIQSGILKVKTLAESFITLSGIRGVKNNGGSINNGILDATIQEIYEDAQWFTDNASFILLEGQRANLLQTGTYKLGDGVTQLQNLSFLGTSSSGVQSVTGEFVDNTDSSNPVITGIQSSLDDKVNIGSITNNKILKGSGTDTATDSQISDNGTDVDIDSSSLSAPSFYGDYTTGEVYAGSGVTTKKVKAFDGDSTVVAGNRVILSADDQNELRHDAKNYLNAPINEVSQDPATALGIVTKQFMEGLTWLTNSAFGSWVNGLTSKTTPVDADQLDLMDSADSNKSKKLSWLNVKATLKTYFDTLYNTVTGAAGRKYFAYDHTTFTYTGTTADTIVKTISIPANSMLSNSTLDLFANFTKTGTNGIFSMYLYITTNSSAITGGTRIGSNGTGANATLQFGKRFRLSNKGSQTSQLGQTASNNAENFSSQINAAKQSLSIDFTVQQYIHIVMTAASAADTVGITDYQMYIDHP